MKKEPIIVNVYLWGTCIGKLNWDFEKHCSVFQFTDEYRKQDYDICPSTHPKRTPLFASFYGNKDKLYQGLPEFLADALPDKWGASLFDQWLTDNNIKVTESLPLLKLSYIGKRAMGALEFEPEFNDDAIHESVNMSSLATLASKIYNDRDAAVISPEDSLTMKKLIYLGTSAGGMRPKAVVAYNLETEEFRSGQEDLPENFKQYIIKFKEADDSPTTEIEMVYSEMAKAAGINMVSCFLKEIDGRNHFVTERFDRKDGDKILSQPLAAIMPGADDYMKLCWLAETLKLPQEDKDQIFIRMVFNYVAGISDDYNKNISFIMDKTGRWRLSPAYDVMFTANTWENSSAHIYNPDLILSDVMMPEMGGDELCASVKSDIETSHIPVMLLTALGDEKDMLEGLENGADAYITKPFSINVLRANIRNILANRALLRRAYAGLEDGVGQVPPDCHNTRDWKFMASVRECVMKNIDNPGFCVDMLCGMQNMSRTGFFNKLKALTGHAPADYIRSMRLQYAAQLLREKDCSITEISDDSGFSDVRYFREVFRKYYGMSPSEYRNSMRG